MRQLGVNWSSPHLWRGLSHGATREDFPLINQAKQACETFAHQWGTGYVRSLDKSHHPADEGLWVEIVRSINFEFIKVASTINLLFNQRIIFFISPISPFVHYYFDLPQKKKASMSDYQHKGFIFNLYPRPGSNRHECNLTGFWDQRVYQFRHSGNAFFELGLQK